MGFPLIQPLFSCYLHFQIYISFLFVGHTHEDVDAAFSQIAKTLRQHDVETFDDLLHMLPNGNDVNIMFDVKKWMDPHLVEPEKHTGPLHFRFKAVGESDVQVHHKNLFNHPWEDYPSGFFKSYLNGKKFLPSGTPNQLSPDLDRMDLDRIKKQIKCISYLFSNPENIEWWNSFLESLTNKQKQQRGQWILKSLPRQRPGEEIESLSAGIPPELQKLLDKETARSVVSIFTVIILSHVNPYQII